MAMTYWSLTEWRSFVTLSIRLVLCISLSIYIHVHKYKYIYIYLHTLFFPFWRVTIPLSGVKYRISQMPLYQWDTSNSQLFIYVVAWCNCVCFISKMLIEVIINWVISIFFLQAKRPRWQVLEGNRVKRLLDG